MLLEVKRHVIKARLGSRRFNTVCSSKTRSLQHFIFERKMSHGGGGGVRKGPKQCLVLFEWTHENKTEPSQTESLNCKGKVFAMKMII